MPSLFAVVLGTLALYWRLRRRLWASLMAAPAAAALLLVICFAPIGALAGLAPSPSAILTQWQVLASFALMLTCTVGLAWHAIACRMKWRSLGAYILASALGCAAASFGLAISVQGILGEILRPEDVFSAPSSWLFGALLALIAGLLGGVSMGLFWFIRRPDRDVSAPDLAKEFD
jgi:hypothetical protein